MKVRLVPQGRTVGRWFCRAKLDRFFLHIQKMALGSKCIRAIYYHDTPKRSEDNLELHFKFYSEHFSPVSFSDLDHFLRDKTWGGNRPGLIVAFDDGLRSNFDIALPILEKYGFVGWFFVPTEFVGMDASTAEDWALCHSIAPHGRYNNGRVALSWDEVRELDRRGHIIGCHTKTHRRMTPDCSLETINDEILGSKKILEAQLGHFVDTFCWVGGEQNTYNPLAFERIRGSGYRYCFTTLVAPILPRSDPLFLHRTGISAEAAIETVRFQISGLIDLLFTPQRKRIAKELGLNKS
jgi:peptidoglycan/xylan/chitin deacetylase (PgdA/CDA1 family)